MRCTAPIKAPGPPPTMPRRKRRLWLWFDGSTGICAFLSVCQAQHFSVRLSIGARLCEIIKRTLGGLDDVMGDERRSLLRALLTILYTALPFKDSPSFEVVLGKFVEDGTEVNLTVPERPEATRT